jgi:hypothetical protein
MPGDGAALSSSGGVTGVAPAHPAAAIASEVAADTAGVRSGGRRLMIKPCGRGQERPGDAY